MKQTSDISEGKVMFSQSQTLSIIGLVLEFISVLIIAYKTFYPWNSKDRKMQYIEDKGKKISQKIEEKKWLSGASIISLSIGMLLQAIGLLI